MDAAALENNRIVQRSLLLRNFRDRKFTRDSPEVNCVLELFIEESINHVNFVRNELSVFQGAFNGFRNFQQYLVTIVSCCLY